MSKKEYAKEPLLYIHQPELNQPKASMQHHFIGNRKESVQPANETKESITPRKTRGGRQVNASANNENFNQKNHELNSEKKQFKEMSISEKIDYFVGRSEYAPPINCLVITDRKKYRGVILEMTDEEVKFRLSNRKSSIKINYEDIKDIQLVGF
ncbi:CotO family spore coat protein [Oceanobacillus kimchii]|uniref:CotO family spore coat protein n=1 Tax=Oceanobacillus kimchii TaxID=746691 RepID=UPI000986355E|nr:CotO family spore coat protein [Oceanobacillus kimchii]